MPTQLNTKTPVPQKMSSKKKTSEESQDNPAPKCTRSNRMKFVEHSSSKPIVDEALEITYVTSNKSITVASVCQEWQTYVSTKLELNFVRSNRVNHGSGAYNILINKPLETCRVTPDGNSLF